MMTVVAWLRRRRRESKPRANDRQKAPKRLSCNDLELRASERPQMTRAWTRKKKAEMKDDEALVKNYGPFSGNGERQGPPREKLRLVFDGY